MTIFKKNFLLVAFFMAPSLLVSAETAESINYQGVEYCKGRVYGTGMIGMITVIKAPRVGANGDGVILEVRLEDGKDTHGTFSLGKDGGFFSPHNPVRNLYWASRFEKRSDLYHVKTRLVALGMRQKRAAEKAPLLTEESYQDAECISVE